MNGGRARISDPTVASTAVDPADMPTKKTSIWDDPNLLAIMLGTMGQAVMGRHQQSWQAQLGKGAVGLGQSFKMAQLAAKRREEEEKFWKAITGAISGEAPPEAVGSELEGLGLSSPAGGYQPRREGTVYPYTQRRRVGREEPPSPYGGGGGELSIFDVLGQ